MVHHQIKITVTKTKNEFSPTANHSSFKISYLLIISRQSLFSLSLQSFIVFRSLCAFWKHHYRKLTERLPSFVSSEIPQ